MVDNPTGVIILHVIKPQYSPHQLEEATKPLTLKSRNTGSISRRENELCRSYRFLIGDCRIIPHRAGKRASHSRDSGSQFAQRVNEGVNLEGGGSSFEKIQSGYQSIGFSLPGQFA